MLLCPAYSYYVSPWYEISLLIEELAPLMFLLVPPVIGYMLWRIFVTNRMNPRGNVCVLGLTETSATQAEMYGRSIKWKFLALYACTSWLTFNLGLIAFDFYYYVTERLSTLFD
jgi:hypothetical protein